MYCQLLFYQGFRLLKIGQLSLIFQSNAISLYYLMMYTMIVNQFLRSFRNFNF